MSPAPVATHYVKMNADLLQFVRSYYETENENHLNDLLKALTKIFDSYLHNKYGTSTRQAVRDDIRQDALLKVLELCRQRKVVVDEGEMLAPISAWFRGICSIVAMESLTSKKGRPSLPGPDEDPFLLLISVAAPPEELMGGTEYQSRAAELLKAATKVVLSLDPNVKSAVVMHFYHSLPWEVAAQNAGISIPKYRGRLNRGIKVLSDWARQQNAPSAEVYSALISVNTGDLFRDPPARKPTARPNRDYEKQREYKREYRAKMKQKSKDEAADTLII